MRHRPMIGLAVVLAFTLLACGSNTAGGPTGGGGGGDMASQPDQSQGDVATPTPDAISDATPTPDEGPDAPAPADVTPDDGPPADAIEDQAPPADATADADTDGGGGQHDVLTIDGFFAILDAGDEAGLDDYLVQYDMPVCEDGGCLIVTTQPTAGEVAFIGAATGWSEAIPLSPVPFRPAVFYGLIEGVTGDVSEYKLMLDGEWSLDTSNAYFRFADYGPNSAIYGKAVGRLTRVVDVYSTELDNTRDLYVYLPAAYFADPDARFGVLYMQDGYNVFTNPLATYGTWDVEATADALFAAGLAEPVIVVAIDTDNRMSEYVPIPFEVQVGSGDFVEPLLDEYRDFLTGTIKPLIDERFHTLPDREHTAMAGSSLGGVSSFYIAWTRADVFSRAGCFSTYWVGAEEYWGESEVPSMRDFIEANEDGVGPADLRLYLDSGDTSHEGETGYIQDHWAVTDHIRNLLISMGWDGRPEYDTDDDPSTPPADLPLDTSPESVPALAWAPEPPPAYAGWEDYLGLDKTLLSLVGHGHMHNESAWKQRFAAALMYLFPGPALSP
jgi:predicted alpha/beta superfamily hydrolase